MITVRPQLIPEIDSAAERILCLSAYDLICHAGESVARHICERRTTGSVLIFCGSGNNGADGYATALALSARGRTVQAVDVFGKGQKSMAGRRVLEDYTAALGAPLTLEQAMTRSADIAVDAMLGTGRMGELPEDGKRAVRHIGRIQAYTVAVDIPFGVDAEYGEVSEHALRADLTVSLSFVKRGLLSYPAKEYCGELVCETLGLDDARLLAAVEGWEIGLDDEAVRALLPPRRVTGHKGSFGHAMLMTGSKKYRGAATLATLAALRTGVGLLTLATEQTVLAGMGKKLPEVIYRETPPIDQMSEAERDALLADTEGKSALLVGPGSVSSESLYTLVCALLEREGCPLILDADAINALSLHREQGLSALKNARRTVLLTPHPLEFARLTGKTVNDIQAHRLRYTEEFATEHGVALLLKGAATVIAAEGRSIINPTGSTALAKGGSGDVLSGIVTAFAAQGASPFAALAAAAYLHGAAGEHLAQDLSDYGVTPSDLPRQVAMELAALLRA